MLKKERFSAKYNTAMGQIPRSIERISSFFCFRCVIAPLTGDCCDTLCFAFITYKLCAKHMLSRAYFTTITPIGEHV